MSQVIWITIGENEEVNNRSREQRLVVGRLTSLKSIRIFFCTKLILSEDDIICIKAHHHQDTSPCNDMNYCSLGAVVSLNVSLGRSSCQAVLYQEAFCRCPRLVFYLTPIDIFHLRLAEEQSNIHQLGSGQTVLNRTIHPMWLLWPIWSCELRWSSWLGQEWVRIHIA